MIDCHEYDQWIRRIPAMIITHENTNSENNYETI